MAIEQEDSALKHFGHDENGNRLLVDEYGQVYGKKRLTFGQLLILPVPDYITSEVFHPGGELGSKADLNLPSATEVTPTISDTNGYVLLPDVKGTPKRNSDFYGE